jgi:hypothetical protein
MRVDWTTAYSAPQKIRAMTHVWRISIVIAGLDPAIPIRDALPS